MLDIISSFFGVIIDIVVNLIPNTIDIIVKGMEFFISLFSTIPNFIIDNVISCMPPFFQTGFYGLLGVILFILVTKIIALIKL